MILMLLKDIDTLVSEFNKQINQNADLPDFSIFHEKINQLNDYLVTANEEEIKKYQDDIYYLINIISGWKNTVLKQQNHIKLLIEETQQKMLAKNNYERFSDTNTN